MAKFRITITNTKINTSLQVGDLVYYTFIENNLVTELLPTNGMKLIDIKDNADTLSIDVETIASVTIPPNSFLVFSKSIEVNESSVKGYYADVTLENHSREKAELFAISSEIVPSSK